MFTGLTTPKEVHESRSFHTESTRFMCVTIIPYYFRMKSHWHFHSRPRDRHHRGQPYSNRVPRWTVHATVISTKTTTKSTSVTKNMNHSNWDRCNKNDVGWPKTGLAESLCGVETTRRCHCATRPNCLPIRSSSATYPLVCCCTLLLPSDDSLR